MRPCIHRYDSKADYCRDVTLDAHVLLEKGNPAPNQFDTAFPTTEERIIYPTSMCNALERPPKPRSLRTIQMSKSSPELDLSALSQLVHISQTRLIAQALHHLSSNGSEMALRESVDKWIGEWEESLLIGDGGEEGWLASVRAIDLGMAINRIRDLKVV